MKMFRVVFFLIFSLVSVGAADQLLFGGAGTGFRVNEARAAVSKTTSETTDSGSVSGDEAAPKKHLVLTAEERRYIASNPTFTASNEANWPPFNFNVNGMPQGYSVDYMRMLAEMAGLRVEFVSGPDWDEFERRLKNGTLDVVMNMAETPSRKAYAEFTPPYATLVHGIVYRADEPIPLTLENMIGRTVAVPKGFFTETVVRENYPNVKLVTPPDSLGCLQAVSTGRADAAVGSLPVQNYLIQKHFLNNLRTRALVDNHNFPTVNVRFGVTSSRPMLARILTKAMSEVEETRMSELRRKWLSADRMDRKYIPLTPSEQEMLSSLGSVRMCVHPDWMPFSRINEQGKFEGMVADYINLMAGRIGVDLRLVPTASWRESLDGLVEGRCDIIPAAAPTDERRDSMAFTRRYIDFPVVAATLQDVEFVPDIDSLSGKRIGAVPGHAWTEDIRRDYPEVELVEVPSVDEGLGMVRDRKLYALVDSMASVSYAIGRNRFTDLKIAGKLDKNLSLAVGVRKDNPLLAQVFDMAVASLTEKERQDIFADWISIAFEYGIDYDLLWKILAGSGLIFAVVFYWNRKLVRLNRAVSQANDGLNLANAKISTLLDNSGQGFLSFGPDGIVEAELSEECNRIFGKSVAGLPIQELLNPGDERGRDTFARNIERILTQEDTYKQDLFISLMPKHFDLGDIQVDAEYRLLNGERLMLILSDVTDKRALEAEVERERGRLAMIVSAVRDKDDFFRVLEEFDLFVRARVRGEDVTGVDGGWDLPSLYRHVHTFKGLMLQLDFIQTPAALHRVESFLAEQRAEKRAGQHADDVAEVDRERFQAVWSECGCGQALDNDLGNIRAALGSAFFDESHLVPVPEEMVERLGELAAHLEELTEKIGLVEQDYALLREVGQLSKRDLRDLLSMYPKAVLKLAERSDKLVRPFSVEGDEVAVSPREYAPLISSLVHVFRNTVVHGIEDPDTREEAGKPEVGTVVCRVEDAGESLRVIIEDDGQGIDVRAVQDKARELGIEPTGDHEQDLNLIFENDMTTKEDADALAGRGVGLAAVMERLQQLGGSVKVSSVPGQGTCFSFTLPKIA